MENEIIKGMAIVIILLLIIIAVLAYLYLRARQSLTMEKKLNLDLTDKIHYDTLTGIYNRRFLEESLKRSILSLSRSGGLLSVLMIDVDFFKKYNDTYGHPMGDKCLKSLAEALAKGVRRADDFVARYGGEEFVAVLPNTNESGAVVVASKLLESIRELNIPHEESDVADHVTISVGITTDDANHTQNAEEYIKQADKALYLSKKDGRNRYTSLPFA